MSLPLASDSRLYRWRAFWVVGLLAFASSAIAADEPASNRAAKPATARPADALSGKLAHARAKNERQDAEDLLGKIDTVDDVVYSTGESPIPEAEQFQFIAGALRTPEKGDARLVIPVDVPEFYRLTLKLKTLAPTEDRPVGIGLMVGGKQLLLKTGAQYFEYGAVFGKPITGRLANARNREISFDTTGPNGKMELLVGDCGFTVEQTGRYTEWYGQPQQLSLPQGWAMPQKNRLFLTAPGGQFDILAVRLEPLTREKWLDQINTLFPSGKIAWANQMLAKGIVEPGVDSIPDLEALRPTFRLLGYQGDFDALERWADRFRKSQFVAADRLGSEAMYDWLWRLYMIEQEGTTMSPQALAKFQDGYLPKPQAGTLPDYWCLQLAFVDGWSKAKPKSVAARIVKARTLIAYAWQATRGRKGKVSAEDSEKFDKRVSEALALLDATARLSPRDACAYTSLLDIGMIQDWDHAKMEKTLARGLQVTKKDNALYARMVKYLLPTAHGKSGDIAKLADQMAARIKGDDGLDVYAHMARSAHNFEVPLEDFSADKLRDAIPIWVKRYSDQPSMMNFACWLACALGDRKTAKTLFDQIAKIPDVEVWGSRDKFDEMRHWADPAVPGAPRAMPIEGEQVGNFQAASGDLVHVAFMPDNQSLVTCSELPGAEFKFWDLKQPEPTLTGWMPQEDRTLQELRVLPDKKVLGLFKQGEKLFFLQKKPPEYELVAGPLNHRGLEVSLASDDWNTGVFVAADHVTADHSRELARKTFTVPKLSVTALSRDGNYLLGIADKIHVWNTHSGEEIATIDALPAQIAFLEDNSGIVYCTDKDLVVWNLADKQERARVALEGVTVRALASTHDGRLLATAETRDGDQAAGNVVTVWRLDSLKSLHTFGPHDKPLGKIAFSPDGKLLASSSLDGVVKIWDTAKLLDEAGPAAAQADSKASQ